jgi:hypothetical protein
MNRQQIEQYKLRYGIDGELCQAKGCNKRATQIAHRIAQTKVNYGVFGKSIVDHNINMVPVCCLEHNSSFNIGNKPRIARKLAEYIRKNKDKRIPSKKIQKYIENC